MIYLLISIIGVGNRNLLELVNATNINTTTSIIIAVATFITAMAACISVVFLYYNFVIMLRLKLVRFKKVKTDSYKKNYDIYAVIKKTGKGIVKNYIIEFELNGQKWGLKINKGKEPVLITTEYPLFLFSIEDEYIKCDYRYRMAANGHKYEIFGRLSDYKDEKFKFTIISEDITDFVVEKKVSKILKSCKAG